MISRLRTLGLCAILSCSITNAETKLSNGVVLADEPTWIVSYVEANADDVAEVRSLIRAYVEKGKRNPGNLRFEALQRISRENHFVVLEAWSGPSARADHAEMDSSVAFRAALQPLLYAPLDERLHVSLEAASPTPSPAIDASTVFVFTHADIVPPEQFAPCNRQTDESGLCGNELLTSIAKASRQHEGNLRFDILTQSNRGNHMTVVEIWRDADAQSMHQVNPEKKTFRTRLKPLLGSLWDERLYRPIPN